ncbi:unnamed protein product [Discula destructiva]
MRVSPPLPRLLAIHHLLLSLVVSASSSSTQQIQHHHQQQQQQQQGSKSLPSDTIKILVCGDSISQGREYDFTWRYRLWEWFQQQQQQQHAANTPITIPSLQYVGPYDGTLPSSSTPLNSAATFDPSVPQTWGAYHPTVSPAFWSADGSGRKPNASAHFAVYGRPAHLDVDLIGDQVRTHAPDVVVLHLGINDIGWWGSTPETLARSVQLLVFNARVARPNVAVLIADVSHRLQIGGREDIPVTTDAYNALLADKVAEWTLPESPVVIVPVSKEYDCHVDACPAGIDGLHPNALGDFQIARAYTKVLHKEFGFGAGLLTVPPLVSIPGMEAADGDSDGHLHRAVPPVGVFAVVSVACLAVVVGALRRMRRRRRGAAGDGEKLANAWWYSRLSTTVNDEGV